MLKNKLRNVGSSGNYLGQDLVKFAKQLHYVLANLTDDAARLIVRLNEPGDHVACGLLRWISWEPQASQALARIDATPNSTFLQIDM